MNLTARLGKKKCTSCTFSGAVSKLGIAELSLGLPFCIKTDSNFELRCHSTPFKHPNWSFGHWVCNNYLPEVCLNAMFIDDTVHFVLANIRLNTISDWWFQHVWTPLKKKSHLEWFFPIPGTIKLMFQSPPTRSTRVVLMPPSSLLFPIPGCSGPHPYTGWSSLPPLLRPERLVVETAPVYRFWVK